MVHILMFIYGQGGFKSWITVIKMKFLCITLFNAKIEWGENTDEKKVIKMMQKSKISQLYFGFALQYDEFRKWSFQNITIVDFSNYLLKKKKNRNKHTSTCYQKCSISNHDTLTTTHNTLVLWWWVLPVKWSQKKVWLWFARKNFTKIKSVLNHILQKSQQLIKVMK